MARSRNIKPGFFSNDSLAELPALTRLLFIGLWTICDRDGRLEDRPRKIKAEALPYDECNVDAALQALHNSGFIIRYASGGLRCIQVVNWAKHQNPHMKEAESTIPAPDEHQTSTIQTPEPAPDEQQPKPERAGLIPDSLNLIPDSGFLIPEKSAPEKPAATKSEKLLAGIDPQIAADWQAMRKAKRAPVTATAIEGIQREAIKAGLSLQDALAMCCQRGWTGFKADWAGVNGQRAPPNGMTPYQQMQVEKHEQNKRFNAAILGDKPDGRTDAIDGIAERVD